MSYNSLISYWHHDVICLSVCLSVIVLLTELTVN